MYDDVLLLSNPEVQLIGLLTSLT